MGKEIADVLPEVASCGPRDLIARAALLGRGGSEEVRHQGQATEPAPELADPDRLELKDPLFLSPSNAPAQPVQDYQ
eukprot:2488073-Pyramimonas_sp.AAC.1